MSPLGLASVIAILFGSGIYLMLRPHLGKVVLGFILFGNAINLMILSSQKVSVGSSPILHEGIVPSDALPQALILTAIVIGFGMMIVILAVGGRASKEKLSWDSPEKTGEKSHD